MTGKISPEDQPSPEAVLALPARACDGTDAETIRDYLMALLAALWHECEDFSAKRPFGDSGWVYDLYIPLGQAGLVTMTFDDDGFVEDFEDDQRRLADRIIAEAIQHLGVTT